MKVLIILIIIIQNFLFAESYKALTDFSFLNNDLSKSSLIILNKYKQIEIDKKLEITLRKEEEEYLNILKERKQDALYKEKKTLYKERASKSKILSIKTNIPLKNVYLHKIDFQKVPIKVNKTTTLIDISMDLNSLIQKIKVSENVNINKLQKDIINEVCSQFMSKMTLFHNVNYKFIIVNKNYEFIITADNCSH